MSMSSSRRVGILPLCLFFHFAGVLGRGGGKGGEGGEEGEGGPIANGADTGSDIGDAASSGLDLPPELNAVFAITIIIGVITALQFIRSLARFKHLPSRGSELTLPHNVGVLFPVFLTFYTAVYTINNALYAAYIASLGDTFFLPFAFGIGLAFTGQFSTVLFYATFLTIIAYRQRVQLNPHENLFNLKSLLDGLLLTTILFLGVAEDIIAGTSTSLEGEVSIQNLSLAFQVFGFLASLDVAISAFIARARLSNAGIHDKIISTSAFVVGPIVLIGGIYGVINVGLERDADQIFFNFDALLIATVVIEGVVSVLAVAYALSMSAPVTHSGANHDRTIGGKV